jgi:hypothetical protein
MWGLQQFTTKLSGYLVEPENKDRRLGGDGIRVHREASVPRDTQQDRRACVARTQTAAKAWPSDEEECFLTMFPLRCVYLV